MEDSRSNVYVNGLSLKNYRGIGNETQYVGPFKACNFFIGANNSGKSSILNFLSAHLHRFGGRETRLPLSPLEIHLGATIGQVEMGFGSPSDVIENSLSEQLRPHAKQVRPLLHKLVKGVSECGMVWNVYSPQNLQEPRLRRSQEEIQPLLDMHE